MSPNGEKPRTLFVLAVNVLEGTLLRSCNLAEFVIQLTLQM